MLEELLSLQLLEEAIVPAEKQLASLYSLSKNPEQHYHLVRIAKKSGGERKLFVPDPMLKTVQRRILQQILDKQEVSRFATAYRKGSSIRQNAQAHLGQKQILKLDIQDFFSSILFPDVLAACFCSKYFSPAVGTLLTNLCCYQGHLPQGAPTSPAISNRVLYSFDHWLGDWCEKRNIVYTRYCDDLTFSGQFEPRLVQKIVERALQARGFALNQQKTQLITNHERELVTGVVVNEKLQVPRTYRRALRQQLYYCKKYGVVAHLTHHSEQLGQTVAQETVQRYLQSLLGKINFVLQIHPEDQEFAQARIEVQAWLKEVQLQKG